MASRWRHCVDLTGPGIEPQTSRTDSVRLATELTAGSTNTYVILFACIRDRYTIDYSILLPATGLPIRLSSATLSLAPPNFYLNFDI